jgi:hypothetical protein
MNPPPQKEHVWASSQQNNLLKPRRKRLKKHPIYFNFTKASLKHMNEPYQEAFS